MQQLDSEARGVMQECVRLYGALDAVEAFMEYEYADKYHKLPDGARFLSLELVTDRDGNECCIFIWAAPDEVKRTH